MSGPPPRQGLPPRPDFADAPPPPRSEPRPHYYGGRPPPEHYRDRERERDLYISGRSPPRLKHPSRALTDSYVASDRDRDRDSYVPRDAYPPPYDRREHDDRHRGERGWERRDYRDYPPPPPPHADYRYREADPRGWPRDSRDSGRSRYDEPPRSVYIRGARKSPPRAWTQSDEIDRHPRGARPREPYRDDDHRWQARPGLSPPRRHVGSTPPHFGPSSQYPRSPRRRSPSPDPRLTSPRRRSSRDPSDPKSGDYPVPGSPSRSMPYMSRRREDPPRRDRSRSHGPRRRSRSRSASPPRRRPLSRTPPPPRKDVREETLSPGRILEEGEREPSPIRREPPVVPRPQKDEPPPPPAPSARPRPVDTPMDVDSQQPPEPLPTLKVDAPPKSEKPLKEPEPPRAPSAGSATPQKLESLSRPRSPSLLQQRGLTKTPTTPMSPQGRSPLVSLPPKPDWSSTPQATPTVPSAAPPGAESSEASDNLEAIKKELEKYGVEFEKVESLPWVNPEYDRLKSHQRRVEQDYYLASRAARQALYELNMAKIELASATSRRELAVKQLNLAIDGKAGIDWPYDYESLNSPVE